MQSAVAAGRETIGFPKRAALTVMSTARMTWWTPPAIKEETSSALCNGDSALVDAMSNGSRDAFTAIYRKHSDRVFRVALQHTASRELAEEITQESFLFLLRNPKRFDPSRGELGPFLAGVSRQLARKSLSESARNPSAEWDESSAPERADATDALHEMIEHQQWQRLHEAVAMLPEPFRETLVLHHLEGLPYEEVATVLACPIGTVRSRLARAREMLSHRLSECTSDSTAKPPAERQTMRKGGTEDAES